MTGFFTTTEEGHRLLSIFGRTYRIDAQPPEDHQSTAPAPAGLALAPCTACGKPLAALFAVPGCHPLCEPRPLRICGTVWTTLHTVTTDTVLIQLREIPGHPHHAYRVDPSRRTTGVRQHTDVA